MGLTASYDAALLPVLIAVFKPDGQECLSYVSIIAVARLGERGMHATRR